VRGEKTGLEPYNCIRQDLCVLRAVTVLMRPEHLFGEAKGKTRALFALSRRRTNPIET
jgi:hypothetical protein